MSNERIAVISVLGLILAALMFFLGGQYIGTAKVDAFQLLENPHHLKTVDGWYSISGDNPKVIRVLGVYYVSTLDTRQYPHTGRRAWSARSWMIDDDLQTILDNQIEAQMAQNP